MLYRMLDILICPIDGGFPLVLNAHREAIKHLPYGRPQVCRTFCALEERQPSLDICVDCHQREIIEGSLICPTCGQKFLITDGIADLIRPELLDEEASDELKDQLQEIKVRDRMAERYDSMFPVKWASKSEIPLFANILDRMPCEKTIELGCGTGRLTRKLAERSDFVLAVDFSMDSLLVCKKKLKDRTNVQYVRAEISRLPFREKVFSTALSCEVFEHMPTTELRQRAASEAARVLVDDGSFAISVYREFWFSRIFGRKESYHFGGIYYFRFTPAEFRALLEPYFQIEVYYPSIVGYIQMAGCRRQKKSLKQRVKEAVNEKISVVQYDPEWQRMFEEEAELLRGSLPKSIIGRIEHFGSTAVPGLAAKPIIDILVEVSSLEETKKAIVPILKSKGYDYFWRPELLEDPPFYAWFIKRNQKGERTHHIHMVEADSKLWERLYFRDYLREFSDEAKRYAELKQVLAKSTKDRVEYTKAKTDFTVVTTKKAKKYYNRKRKISK